MAVQNKKIGAIIGLIGSVILLIVGLYMISMARLLYYPIPGFPAFLPYIIGGVTIVFSACGLTGAVLVFRDNPIGYIFLLVAGIVGIIGTFIPIYTYDTGYGIIITFYLSSTLLYADLVLMVVGGILGFALAEKKERKE